MYILYGGDFTRAVLVQWVLDEGGLPYVFRKVDILRAENRTPEFLALNPSGLIPVLITPEGEALHEAAALMVYLADRHRLAALAPAADDPCRGRFLSAVFFVASDIQPDMKRFHYPHRYTLRPEDSAAVRDLARSLVLARLDVVNRRLSEDGPHLLGSRFSLADFYLCFWIAYLDRHTVCSRFPAIGRLYDLVRSRPRAGTHLAETEKAADAYADMRQRHPEGVIA